ncbi:MFS transporter [Maridesulfovibrio bastinii]|uniref:MFS transporter n=1 Tax=Maridesulfovibrio bastinii TaxID=47157 RepID=UPI000429A4E6|nr:MFS transporter [Maridesulfovibrio bastinii]
MAKIYKNKNLQIIFAVTLVAIMGVSSIIPSLPLIIKAFGIKTSSIGLIFTVFTLPGIIFSPLAGVFADRTGRKKILVPSLVLFGLAGAACYFAPTFEILLVLRLIQGIGAAAVGVLSLTIIGDLFEGRERIKAMGLNAGVLSMGTAILPAIGGILAQMSWRAPFLLSLSALPMAWVVSAKLNNPEPKSDSNLIQYVKNALSGMKNLQVLGLFAITLLTFIILYGPIITYLPVMMHNSFSSQPITIGIVISSASFITAISAAQMGKLSRYFSQKTLIGISAVAYAASMYLVPQMTGPYWCILPVCFFGLGQGLNLPNTMSFLSSLAPIEHRAAFMSMNGMLLRLGQTIAPLLMGLIYSGLGINAVFYSGVVVSACIMAVSILTLDKKKPA